MSGNEKDVRISIYAIRMEPSSTEKVLTDLLVKNESLFKFERMLEDKQSD